MIGDGIIVESIASFKITWKNPGNGMQAVWDQENQVIEIHGSDVYPDLEFVSLTGLSTYFTHSTADKIIGLLKRINEVINSELTKLYKSNDQANEAVEASFANEVPKPKEPGAEEVSPESNDTDTIPKIKPETTSTDDEVTNEEEPKVEPEVPKSTSEGFAYTVTVHGDKLRFIDASSETHTLVIKHKLSNNMGVKKETGETLDNSSRIWATVQLSGLFSETHRFNFEKFNISTDSTAENLLVQIIPSIQLTFKAGENMTTPETERETYVSKIELTKNKAKLKDLQRELELYKKQLKKVGGTEPTEADLEAARKADTQ